MTRCVSTPRRRPDATATHVFSPSTEFTATQWRTVTSRSAAVSVTVPGEVVASPNSKVIQFFAKIKWRILVWSTLLSLFRQCSERSSENCQILHEELVHSGWAGSLELFRKFHEAYCWWAFLSFLDKVHSLEELFLADDPGMRSGACNAKSSLNKLMNSLVYLFFYRPFLYIPAMHFSFSLSPFISPCIFLCQLASPYSTIS